MQMVFRLRANNCNYLSAGSVACIVLLLSGFIQSYSYMANLSFDSRAFGQEPTVEVGDDQVKITRGQEPTVEVGDDQVKITRGQEPTVEDERPEESNDGDGASTPTTSTEDAISEDTPPPQQAQPPSSASASSSASAVRLWYFECADTRCHKRGQFL